MTMHNDARRVRLLLAEHIGNPDRRQERDERNARVLHAMAAWERRDAEQRWAVRYSLDGGKTFWREGPFTSGQAPERLRQLLMAAEPVYGARVEPYQEPRPAAQPSTGPGKRYFPPKELLIFASGPVQVRKVCCAAGLYG